MKPSFLTSIVAATLLTSAVALGQDAPPPLPPPTSTGTPSTPPELPPPSQPPSQPPPSQPPPAQPEGARAAPPPYHADEAPEGAPLAHTGFQMALRLGPMFPMGDTGKDATGKTVPMSDVYGWQVPLIVELGGKPIPNLFLGGYIGLGFGGASGNFATACDKLKMTCVAASFRLGLEIQYHIMPGEKLNPWIGYGIGLESVGVSGRTDGGATISNFLSGPEYAHFMGGLDFRLSKGVGVGPLIDFAVGTYTHQKVETGQGPTQEHDIASDARTTHFWLFIGGRLVVFP